jgi:hypothetical protein
LVPFFSTLVVCQSGMQKNGIGYKDSLIDHVALQPKLQSHATKHALWSLFLVVTQARR